MPYMILIYLLLNAGIGQTVQQQRAYATSWSQNHTIVDACKVKNDPNFPKDYNCGGSTTQQANRYQARRNKWLTY